MNDFYSIGQENKEPDDAFQLRNLGHQKPLITYGSTRRGSDFWGESSAPRSKTVYGTVTSDDYDDQMAYKLITTKPIYELDKVLDYHYKFYVSHNASLEEKFIKHIKYVVLPLIQKRSGVETCLELLNEWLGKQSEKAENKDKIPRRKVNNKSKSDTSPASIQSNAIVSTVHPIHFEDWDGFDFEWLVFCYLKSLKTFSKIRWLGQTGKDGGRDIWAEKAGKTYCYQCANYYSLKLKKATDDIDKLIKGKTIPVHFILVCGGRVSAASRDSVISHATLNGIQHADVWSGREFEEDIRNGAPSVLKRFVKGEPFPELDESGQEINQQTPKQAKVRKAIPKTVTISEFSSKEVFQKWFQTLLKDNNSAYYSELKGHWNSYSLREDSPVFTKLIKQNLSKSIDFGMLPMIADFANEHLNYDIATIALYNRPHLYLHNRENEGYNLPVFHHIKFIGILYATAIRNKVDIDILSHQYKSMQSIFSGMIQKMIPNIHVTGDHAKSEYPTGYHWLIGEILSLLNNWLDSFNEKDNFNKKSSYVDYIPSNIGNCLSELYKGVETGHLSQPFVVQQVYYGVLNDYFSPLLDDSLRSSIEQNVIADIPNNLVKPVLKFALDEKYAVSVSSFLENKYRVLNQKERDILSRFRTFLIQSNKIQAVI